MSINVHCAPYMTMWLLIYVHIAHISLCDEFLMPWNFVTFGLYVKLPQDPKMKIKCLYFLQISDFNLLDFCHISLKWVRWWLWNIISPFLSLGGPTSFHPQINSKICVFTLRPIYEETVIFFWYIYLLFGEMFLPQKLW